MNKFIAAILSCLFISCTLSENLNQPSNKENSSTKNQKSSNSLVEYCKTASCRKNVRFRLKKKDGTYFEFSSKLAPPVIQPSFISIFPEETIYIEADKGKNGPINLVHVTENKNPKKTIVFNFTKDKKLGKGYSMVLKVHNPFSKPLRYNLGIMPIDSEKLFKTSSCPVIAGGFVYELWSYPIFQIVVAKLRFLNKGDDFGCK